MSLSDRAWAAVEGNNLAELQELIDRGFRIEPEYSELDRYTIMHWAAQLGRATMIAPLMKVSPPGILEYFDVAHSTPLAYAATNNDLDTVAELIRAGADVNARDEEHIGETALARAIEEDASKEIVELLLRSGADPNIRGWMQRTPLERAEKRIERRKDQESERILDLCQKYSVRNRTNDS